MLRGLYSIYELTREFGVTARALRFYEDKGLVTPARYGKHRYYHETDRQKIIQILRARRLNLSLAEISDLIISHKFEEKKSNQLKILLQRVQNKQKQLLLMQQDLNIILQEFEYIEDRITESLLNR